MVGSCWKEGPLLVKIPRCSCPSLLQLLLVPLHKQLSELLGGGMTTFFFFFIVCLNELILVQKFSKPLCYAATWSTEPASGEWQEPSGSMEVGTGSYFPIQCVGTMGWVQCEVSPAAFVVNSFGDLSEVAYFFTSYCLLGKKTPHEQKWYAGDI